MAHERQLIEKGSCVKLTLDESKAVNKSSNSDEDAIDTKETISHIKLQLVKKGTFRDSFIDIDLANNENPFTTES